MIDVRDTTSWSLFGSAEYDLTERLTVDAQLRYGEEDKFVTGYLWDESDLTLQVSDSEPFLSGKSPIDQAAGMSMAAGAAGGASDAQPCKASITQHSEVTERIRIAAPLGRPALYAIMVRKVACASGSVSAVEYIGRVGTIGCCAMYDRAQTWLPGCATVHAHFQEA